MTNSHSVTVETTTIVLDGQRLEPEQVQRWAAKALDPKAGVAIELTPGARDRIDKSAHFISKVAYGPTSVYGVNTGFGSFAETPVPPDRLGELQRNLIVSHAVGVGDELPRDLVLAMWLLRLNTMCQGRSGVRLATVERALTLLQHGILASVPSRGSVGASGDLAPSAHAVLPLLGEGSCSRPRRDGRGFERVSAATALADLGLVPSEFGPKEGLALINGTQLTTALAIRAWDRAVQVWHAANLSAAMLMQALGGAFSTLEEGVLATHHPATAVAGKEMAAWLVGGSDLDGAAADKRFIQAPYSMRCAPQVHGAVWDELHRGGETVAQETRVVSDNPLVFADAERVVSAGNFHAIYPARVSDRISSAMATLGSISERRTNLAMDERLTGLPRFLVADGGLNSGMMMLQVTAAALVSEAKTLAVPASIDSIPTNCDREDHVSMGPLAGLKALQGIERVRDIVAIELIVAAQALDMGALGRMGPRLAEAHRRIRCVVPFLSHDRVMAGDISEVAALIESGALLRVSVKERGVRPGVFPETWGVA
jgi:histidine ammonia-lyase